MAFGAWAALTACSTGLRAETVKFYTTNAPPMTMAESDVSPSAHGFVADIVAEAAKRAGVQLEFETVPWRRAQTLVAAGEDLLITPLVRLPSREMSYTWIAPIYRFERAFGTLGARIDSFEEARRKLRRILVGKGTAQEATLVEEGFPDEQLHRHEINVAEIDMLVTGRADGWFNSPMVMRWRWHKAGLARPLVIGAIVDAEDIYLACSKSCSAGLVDRLRAAIEAMRSDGTIAHIQALYIGAD